MGEFNSDIRTGTRRDMTRRNIGEYMERGVERPPRSKVG